MSLPIQIGVNFKFTHRKKGLSSNATGSVEFGKHETADVFFTHPDKTLITLGE